MEFANILTRKEMKKIKGGSDPNSTCECDTEECSVVVKHFDHHWTMDITCDGTTTSYGAGGCWGGSACGGVCVAVC